MATQYESAIVMGAITPEIKHKVETANALKRKLDAQKSTTGHPHLETLKDAIDADFDAFWRKVEDHEGYEYGQSLIDYRAGYLKALENLERRVGLELSEITHVDGY